MLRSAFLMPKADKSLQMFSQSIFTCQPSKYHEVVQEKFWIKLLTVAE